MDGERGPSRKEFELPVSKADKRFFPFAFRGDETGDSHGIISEVSVDNGCKYIKLRSIVQIKNHFDRPINIFVRDESAGEYLKLCSLESDKLFDVPVEDVYRSPHTFHFQVLETCVSYYFLVQTKLTNVELAKTAIFNLD